MLWMSGDEAGNGTVHDLSSHLNDGTITGGTAWNMLPDGTWYLTLNGDTGLVNFGNDVSLQPTNAFTIVMWLKPNTLVNWDAILGKTTSGGWNNGFGAYAYSGALRFWVNWYQTTGVTTPPLTPGAWQQVVLTFNKDLPSSNLQCFINGAAGSSRNYTSPVTATPGNFFFGDTHGTGLNYRYDGSMAMLRVFNTAWTVAEVQSSFNAEKARFGL